MESLSFIAWAAIGAISLAPVGALFGAVAGAVARAGGRSPGGAAGRAFVEFLSRSRRKDFSPVVAGAISGATDGAIFLAVVGLIVGLIAGYGGSEPDGRILVVVVTGALALALAAVGFGALSHFLRHGGQRALIVFAAIGIGGLLGLSLAGIVGAAFGLMVGTVVGGVGVLVHGREEPEPVEEDLSAGDDSCATPQECDPRDGSPM